MRFLSVRLRRHPAAGGSSSVFKLREKTLKGNKIRTDLTEEDTVNLSNLFVRHKVLRKLEDPWGIDRALYNYGNLRVVFER